jgi:hypothetical protein
MRQDCLMAGSEMSRKGSGENRSKGSGMNTKNGGQNQVAVCKVVKSSPGSKKTLRLVQKWSAFLREHPDRLNMSVFESPDILQSSPCRDTRHLDARRNMQMHISK